MIVATRGMRLLVVAWLVLSVVFTAVQLRYPVGGLSDASYLLVASAAAVAAWVGVHQLPSRDRTVGVLLAAGITSTGLGDAVSVAIGWQIGAEPEVSAADIGWLGSYALIGLALVLLLRRADPTQRRDLDGLIDVAAIFVAGMMVIWELAVVATVTDGSQPFVVRVVWGLYPVLDMALLALVLRLVMRDRTVTSVLIAIGLGLWLCSDFAYLAFAEAESYSVVLDGGWLWGMVLIALALLHGPSTRAQAGVRPRRPAAIDEVGLARVMVALLPLLVPALIELNGYLRGQDVNPAVTVAGTLILVVLVFVRMARLALSAHAARSALRSQSRYASALAANSADAVVVADADLRLVDSFPRLAELIGHPGRDVKGTDLLELVAAEDLAEARAVLRRSFASPGQVFGLELRVDHGSSGPRESRPPGRRRWLAARVVNLLPDPDVRGVVVNLHDITDRKRAEEELGYQAFHDSLTGLANRALFRDRLDHAMDRRSYTGAQPAVIFLDLDGFKTVNDSLGHDVGDELLREVAARLVVAVRRGETVGRLGGDEFAILIEQSDQPEAEAVVVAERVQQALRDPVPLGDHLADQRGDQQATITASIGIAVADSGTDSAGLLRDADVAMYQSKATGKNKWTAHHPGLRTAALERLEVESGLRRALARDELRLVYQPVVALASDQVMGFEALLRWDHPRFGRLPPDKFIPFAEESGLIVPIGRWVLGEATRTAARWRRQFPDRWLSMAVNISARQLASPGLVDDVAEALAASGLEPERLILEMTETTLVHDPAAAAAYLRRLHQRGVRLAIDDFGTGYSSLSYLRQFPIDILKIDRSFVNAITERDQIPAIVRGLLDLGRTLHLQTVAEGVERDVQRHRLRDENCDLAQGFLFARPMSAAEAEHLLAHAPGLEVATVSQAAS